MRWSLIALLIASCEASAPNQWQDSADTADTVDPYGDSDCPPMPVRWAKVIECKAKKLALLGKACVTEAQAVDACKVAAQLCYHSETGLCVGCWQL